MKQIWGWWLQKRQQTNKRLHWMQLWLHFSASSSCLWRYWTTLQRINFRRVFKKYAIGEYLWWNTDKVAILLLTIKKERKKPPYDDDDEKNAEKRRQQLRWKIDQWLSVRAIYADTVLKILLFALRVFFFGFFLYWNKVNWERKKAAIRFHWCICIAVLLP